MTTMEEMVEAHLANVQREIVNLQERRSAIEQEIDKLEKYLAEGKEVLSGGSSPQTKSAQTSLF